jgi:hypothetical protein
MEAKRLLEAVSLAIYTRGLFPHDYFEILVQSASTVVVPDLVIYDPQGF